MVDSTGKWNDGLHELIEKIAGPDNNKLCHERGTTLIPTDDAKMVRSRI